MNAVGKDKWTPLHFAARDGHVDVAKVLLQNGVDLNAATKYKDTALHTAAEKGHFDIVKVLLEKGADVYAPAPCRIPFHKTT